MLCLIAFYPGYMSPDSVDQWIQGRQWVFWDYHPPFMSAVWGILDRVFPGPFGMLVLHNAMFWGGAAIFWRCTWRKSILLGLGLITFAYLPPVLALLSTIWKDVGMGSSLLMASALLYTANKTSTKAFLWLSPVFLFYGYAVRLNASPAILPLALWTAVIACRIVPGLKLRAKRFRFLPVVCGVIYFLIIALGANLATSILVKGRVTYPYQQVMLLDLSALSKTTDENLFPPHVRNYENFSLEKVRDRYSPYTVNPLIYGDRPPIKLSTRPDEVAEVRASWLRAVWNHKWEYLKSRGQIFMHLSSFNEEGVAIPYLLEGDFHNPAEFKSKHGTVSRIVNAYVSYFSQTVLFRGFLWITICLGSVYLSSRGKLHEDLETVFVLSTSGLLYALAYFFWTPSSEFRYLWWTVLSGIVSLLFLLAYVHRQWRGQLR
jgi:hypothetical protein